MGRRGPAPTPAKLKLLNGRSPGRDSGGRLVAPPAAFERVAPECPDWLPPGAKDMWGRVVPELAALNLLKESDLGVLVSYCVAWDQLVQAVKTYREQGFAAVNARSRRVTVHPAVAAARAAMKDVLVLARELGCTPSAEANLAAVMAAAADNDDGEFNPFAD
ncbi:putative prophage protein [Mycobacterium canetti]|uniref:phage terminase small subunit P27 family n=1 Tax=Mycobacterium canetti TaxID=78331 RepID=UPI002D78322F|nr:phage terminase small subunit P27 family [Mycobacterium canetti]WRO41762.1 putative prophage protein [Mycobacterium canetti]